MPGFMSSADASEDDGSSSRGYQSQMHSTVPLASTSPPDGSVCRRHDRRRWRPRPTRPAHLRTQSAAAFGLLALLVATVLLPSLQHNRGVLLFVGARELQYSDTTTMRQQIDLNFVKTEKPQYPGNLTQSNSTNSTANGTFAPSTPVPDWSSLFSPPPTSQPSRYPTPSPTDLPSAAPTDPPSAGPTSVPSNEPTSSPSYEPTVSPASPTVPPTLAPTTTTEPQPQPSLEPTPGTDHNDDAPPTAAAPTAATTSSPSSAAPTSNTVTPTPTRFEALGSGTAAPTIQHSRLVGDDNNGLDEPTAAPTRFDDGRSTAEQNVSLVLVPRQVPFEFNATLSNNPNNAGSQQEQLQKLQAIWESYILERLQASFRNDDAAYVQQVRLVLEPVDPSASATNGSDGQQQRSQPQSPPSGPKQRLRRFLQSSASNSTSTTSLRAEGTAVFQADQDRPMSTLTSQTQSNLNPILTKESLQQAIVLADDSGNSEPAWSVESVQATYPASSSSNSNRRPTTVELVFGFFLLFLATFALTYTLYMLIQRCRTQRKLAKQERQQQAMGGSRDPALRKGSVVAKVPPPQPQARSAASVAAGPSLLSPTIVPSSRTRSPLRINSLPTSTLPESTDEDDDNDLEFYPGLGRSTETDTTNNNPQSQPGDNDDDDEESEFGFQLRQAAYVDQAAWDEYQRRKELLAKEASMFQPSAGGAGTLLPAVMTLRRGVYDDDFMDDGDSKAGSTQQHEGFEVDELGRPVVASLDRVRSFPYGDEKDDVLFVVDDDNDPDREETAVISAAAARAAAAAAIARSSYYDDDDDDNPVAAVQSREIRPSVTRPLRSLRALTSRLRGVDAALQDAVEWTPTGMALRSPPKSPLEGDDPNFEPYGDEHKMTLQESWEQDDPVPSVKPAAFSFMYPLQRQHVSDSTKSTTDTQQSSSTGVQAAAVLRASPTGSTWSTGAAVNDGPRDFPTLDRRELLDKPLPSHDEEDRNEDDDDDDDNAGTERMLREVAMINAYVKRYEQQKRMSERVQAADTQMRRDRERGGVDALPNTSSIGAATHGSTEGGDDTGSKSYSAPYEAMDDSASGQKRPMPRPLTTVKEDLARARHVPPGRGRDRDEEYVGDPGFDPDIESPSGSNDGEEDDASQRLGIQRYAAQRPPILSFRQQHSGRDDRASGGRPIPPPPPPPPRTGPSNFSLSRLRRNRAVLDTATAGREEVMTAARDATGSSSHSMLPFDERGDNATAEGAAAAAPTDSAATNQAFKLSPRARRNNADFNDLLSMFEARPSQTIVPPTIHVRGMCDKVREV
jgi:hypothetical protein